MIFTIAFYVAMALCMLGTLFAVWRWFRMPVGPEAKGLSTRERITAYLNAWQHTLCSRRIVALAWTFVVEILFQWSILKTHVLRWCMHMALFWGFLGLLFMHALDRYITSSLFSNYASTVNPFLFLRNLFGSMVVLGLVIACVRRARSANQHLFTNASDRYAIIILGAIVLSGFALEATKIVSSAAFDRMVEEYSTISEPEEILQLQTYWAQEFGVVFPDLGRSRAPDVLERGRTLHNDYCASCHSRPHAAFGSYALSMIIRPVATVLTRHHAEKWLWYVHFLSCFIGLAYLPFGKMIHLFTSPLSLFGRVLVTRSSLEPALRVTKRAGSLYACTHCGVCSAHCSVAPVFSVTRNRNILPSEKLISMRNVASGRIVDVETLHSISEGNLACTDCYRCTKVCPVGIDLHDLWVSTREEFAQKGYVGPHVWIRRASVAQWAAVSRAERIVPPSVVLPVDTYPLLSDKNESFSACIQCQTCTNVCPVVAHFNESGEDPGLTPQQVMNLLRLGLRHLALGSRMVWDCVTCYLCQEHCPEGIRVGDVFYELKNIAYHTLSPYQHQMEQGRKVNTRRSEHELDEE